MTNENETKPVELANTGVIEMPTIDIKKHIGKKVKIDSVTEKEGKFGYFIDVSTETLEVIPTKEGKEPIILKANKRFSLFEDKNHNIGWGEKTMLGLFLAKMKCNHYKELVGKEVIVQSVTSKADGKDYLTFN